MRPLPFVKIALIGILFFSIFPVILLARQPKPFSATVFHSTAQKPNQMKIDSITAGPGQLVSVTVSITNDRPVGLIYMRMSYDPNFLSFQGATPAPRMASWPIFGEDADTLPGEIHVVGIADSLFPMQPDSGPVGYLNFQVINQPIPPGTSIPICFVFREPDDNRMYDDTGAVIDTTEIDYVCGEIALITTGITDQQKNRPDGFELGQNYPNPFNPSTSFILSMPKSGRYSVRIYNLAGQMVKIFEGDASAGTHTLNWNGTDQNGIPVASGIYFYKAETKGFSQTKKMILVR